MDKAAQLITEMIERRVERETMREFISQVVYGNEPSEGLPDVRPRHPQYHPQYEEMLDPEWKELDTIGKCQARFMRRPTPSKRYS